MAPMNENTIMVAKINAQLSTFCHKHERSFPEKGEANRHDTADDDTGSKGKRKDEVILFTIYLCAKPTDPWDLILYHKD
jgi:hypothetical protein